MRYALRGGSPNVYFNPHSPTGSVIFPPSNISILTPLRGGVILLLWLICTVNLFQSSLPYGGCNNHQIVYHLLPEFQSSLPYGECNQGQKYMEDLFLDFNPHSHTGSVMSGCSVLYTNYFISILTPLRGV